LYYESADALMAVTIGDRSGAPEPGTPERLFVMHTQGCFTDQPYNVGSVERPEVPGEHGRWRQRQRTARSHAQLGGGTEEMRLQWST
jgi:hypothetical protein